MFNPEESQEERMARLLQILRSDLEIERVKSLSGKDAETFLDSVQELLENDGVFPRPQEDVLFVRGCRLVDRLSRNTGHIPRSLFASRGTSSYKREPFHGAHSDIYSTPRHDGLDFSGPVILKCLRTFEDSRDRDLKKLCREALVWRRLHHPFVLKFLGIDNQTFPSPHLCLLSPFLANGTIMQYRKARGPHNISLLRSITEIAEGLQYIHAESVIHGDLHAGNILIDDEGHVKLVDFGLASFVEGTITESMRSGLGHYIAPELFGPVEGDPATPYQKTIATDIFAFAAVCYEVYRGHRPLHQYTLQSILGELFPSPRADGQVDSPRNPWLRLPQPSSRAGKL